MYHPPIIPSMYAACWHGSELIYMIDASTSA